MQDSKKEFKKIISLVKMVENLPGVSGSINTYHSMGRFSRQQIDEIFLRK